MGGEQSLRHYSPEIVVQDPNARNAVSLLPPMILFHGTADYSIPSTDRYLSLCPPFVFDIEEAYVFFPFICYVT